MAFVQGQGDPVIFVHGNGSTHETWAGVIGHLGQDFRCVSYDLRGHGTAPGDAGRLDIEAFVEDLETLRRELGFARAAFVGHSLGAVIAAAYALKHPDRVTALGLLAAPAARTAADRLAADALIHSLRTRGVKATMSTLVKSWYTDRFVAEHPEALRDRLSHFDTIDDDVFIRTYALYSRTDIDAWLARIGAPTLVLTGEFARGAGADVAGFIASRLADARLVVIAGLKNGILTEVPAQVAGEIRAFLRPRQAAPAMPA
ncbi:MAG: alpha/beta hydrolase [Rhizobiales bacterium]|nr:alpha/beta hydrolase [Hyphomicrobiales bacterium]